jgi:hypothetical protein
VRPSGYAVGHHMFGMLTPKRRRSSRGEVWCDHVELHEKERRVFKLHFPTSRASPIKPIKPIRPCRLQATFAEQSRRRSLSASPVKVAPRPRLGVLVLSTPSQLSLRIQYHVTTSHDVVWYTLCEYEYLLALGKAANVSCGSVRQSNKLAAPGACTALPLEACAPQFLDPADWGPK